MRNGTNEADIATLDPSVVYPHSTAHGSIEENDVEENSAEEIDTEENAAEEIDAEENAVNEDVVYAKETHYSDDGHSVSHTSSLSGDEWGADGDV